MTKRNIPPQWLDKMGKLYWSKITPAIASVGKLDALSYDLIGTLCQAYSDYRRCLAKIASEGMVTVNPKTGVTKVNCHVTVQTNAFGIMCRVWRELDLAGKPPIPPPDELDAFIEKEV
jgi:P27 family predicted phage terminase small subunit